jgi:hypothetical protein
MERLLVSVRHTSVRTALPPICRGPIDRSGLEEPPTDEQRIQRISWWSRVVKCSRGLEEERTAEQQT